MRRRLIVLAIAIALAGALVAALPPPAQELSAPDGSRPLVRGSIHVHSNRSDGSGTVEEIAAAAARAGLSFVVFTDHGDATRRPDPPSYRSGVLCIDAVEVSTDNGHVVALGLPQSPYPLGGESRDVVEDIARMGGAAIAAHPGSGKPELRWSNWAPRIDGLEWLNADSEWRDESLAALARALVLYPFRRPETLGSLLDRPNEVLERWDALTQTRRVFAVAAADAHARLGLRGAGDPYDGATTLRIPSYEQIFRTFSIALPQLRFSGDAAGDAQALIAEIRRGHSYSSIDALARPAALTFTATSGRSTVGGGDVLPLSGPAALRVDTNAPAGSTIVLVKDGKTAATGAPPSLEYTADAERGVFRVEVRLPTGPGDPPIPWLVSNPIYVGEFRADHSTPRHSAATATEARWSSGATVGWTTEQSVRSQAALDVIGALNGQQLLFRYALAGTVDDNPYAAVVMPAGERLAGFDRLTFTVRSDHPTRLVVQARAPGGTQGERWRRSIYVDETPRTVTVFFDEMAPIGETAAPSPDLARVNAVLFVVDTVNTKIGTSGQILIDEIRVAR